MTVPAYKQYDNVSAALERFRVSIEAVAGPFQVWRRLRQRMAQQEVLRALNEESCFWQPILWSLQSELHIGMGRVFDGSKGTFSTRKLRKVCKDNAGAFRRSLVPYQKRWQSLDDDGPAEILLNDGTTLSVGDPVGSKREFTEQYVELDRRTLNRVLAWLDDAQEEYKRALRDPRNEVFAHSNDIRGENPNAHFRGVNVTTVQNILDTLHTTHEALFGALHNGQAVTDTRRCHFPHQDLEPATERVLKKLMHRPDGALSEPHHGQHDQVDGRARQGVVHRIRRAWRAARTTIARSIDRQRSC